MRIKRYWVFFTVLAMLMGSIPTVIAAAEPEDSPLLGNAAVKKPSAAGALKLAEIGGQLTLTDSQGEKIQLRGMSTHGLQWFPDILNEHAFTALADDWNANLIRLAMYVGESGYATSPAVIKQRVIDGIDLAIASDLYVIVDWHVHAPGSPADPIYSGAMDFFDEISDLYPNDPHILYELANEPSSNNTDGAGITNDADGWTVVKNYAQPIVDMLRGKGNKNAIIVGNPNWSQRPDLAADDPIVDPENNTLYTVHFYTGTHQPAADSTDRSNVMSNARYALEHGAAIFATEWGTSEASGNNGPYLDEADTWLTFLNENNVSWANWSLTNKNETSAAFIPYVMGKSEATSLDPGDDEAWALEELSVSGEYVRARIKGIPYEPIDRTEKEDYSTVVWDFNDGSTQGFGKNSDSPNNLTLSNDGNALKIEGLDNTGIWSNRISSDGRNPGTDVKGAQSITMDVIADAPATVLMAAVPQSASAGWTSPNGNGAEVGPGDFVLQVDGTYKAELTLSGDSAPNLAVIANHPSDNALTNVILLISSDASVIKLDNITVNGNREAVEQPVVHDPIGTAALPSDFEDGTRQGWDWDSGSGVKTALTIEEAGGSSALSWAFAYPDVKPDDNWASAPRLTLYKDNLTLGTSDYLAFDLYLEPERATAGAISINLIFQPPTMGYWAQASDTYTIDLGQLDSVEQTADGLYRYQVWLDARTIANIADDTVLRNAMLIFADVDSDFAGRIYLDNARLEPHYNVQVGDLANGTITASVTKAAAGMSVVLTISPDSGYRLKSGTLKANDTAIEGDGFTMPASDVVIAAEFEAIPSSPTPSANPTVGSNPPAPDQVVVNEPAVKDGKIEVALGEGKKTVLLPAKAGAVDGKNDLNVTAERASVTIPGSVLNQLKSLVSADALKDARISLTVQPLGKSEADALTDAAGDRHHAKVGTAGDVYELKLAIVDKDGKETALSTFEQPITLALNVLPGADKDLVGIYYVGDNGELEYVGGQWEDGKLVAQIRHFSRYAVLQYEKTFDDVSDAFWAADVIKKMAAKHVIVGVGDAKFAPDKSVSRAEFTAMLVRALGLTASGKAGFEDLAEDDPYAEAVAAAVEAGIVSGMSASKFAPEKLLSREEMAVMLVRAYEYKTHAKVAAGDATFADAGQISGWAQEAVSAAKALGFLSGRGNDLFVPKGVASRAESAQVVWQLLQK